MPITGECSGWDLLLTPWGADRTGFLNIVNWSTPTSNTLYDAVFYQDATDTTRRLIVTGREGINNRIYVINPADLSNSVVTLSSGVPNPMGISLGTLSDAKTYVFYGPGNVAFGSLTATPILKLDFLPMTPVQSLFRNISLSNGNDNANVRATAFVPSGSGGPAENEVFAFNPNPSSGTQLDIRLGKETTTGFTTWANLTGSVSGTTIDRNYPGGLGLRDQFVTVGSPFSFYVTNGKTVGTTPIKSQVLYYNSDTASPPNHALLWTSPFDTMNTKQTKPYITNAAQIAKENWGEEFAFVADRGNTNPPVGFDPVPSRIFKMNANNCILAADCPATGATKAFLSAFEYGRSMTDIKGVAIQKGTDVLGGTYSKYLWLINKLPSNFTITGNGLSQVRALREIPIQVVIAAHAGSGPAYPYLNGGAWVGNVDAGFVKQKVLDNIADINKSLYSAGYQYNLDPSADMTPPVPDSDLPDYGYRVTGPGGTCPAELSALLGRLTINPKRILILVVHAIRDIDSNAAPAVYLDGNGVYHRYSAPCGGVNEIILMNYVSSRPTPPPPPGHIFKNAIATNRVFSHELFHRLTISLGTVTLANAGYDALGHRAATCPGHLMCPIDQLANTVLYVGGSGPTDRDDDLANVNNTGPNGFGTTLILPDNGVP